MEEKRSLPRKERFTCTSVRRKKKRKSERVVLVAIAILLNAVSGYTFPPNFFRRKQYIGKDRPSVAVGKPAWSSRTIQMSSSYASNTFLHYKNDTARDIDISTASLNDKLWKRRNARTAVEGIRKEQRDSETHNSKRVHLLSTILDKAGLDLQRKQYAARTITGLIHALADEAADLEVDVDAERDTPFWNKKVHSIRIRFSRLGFKPLRMGGHHPATLGSTSLSSKKQKLLRRRQISLGSKNHDEYLLCADTAFEQIDLDDSGALDRDELATALSMAAFMNEAAPSKAIEVLADDLLKLYDANGDGVVDRDEYQRLVEDMAALQKADSDRKFLEESNNWFNVIRSFASGILGNSNEEPAEEIMERAVQQVSDLVSFDGEVIAQLNETHSVYDLESDLSITKNLGTITFANLRLDLRRLVFGAIPILKSITPGGPLILEPFTTTVEGSFTREDILDSFLLDAGLRRLVARALRRRVRSFRDFIDGAVFHGRSWNAASASAPVVEVPRLTDVEFDDEGRLIITGRAIVKTRSDSPQIENAFKVRTKLGTRADGQVIRLVEPELAFVLECPRAWERSVESACNFLNIAKAPRPQPIYSFFPIYSPFKVDDNDGFDMGQDNSIKSIYVQDGALRFEISAVLRPGRFLGNHYIAFSIPNRSFIITLDRVKNGMKAARQEKKYKESVQKEIRRRRTQPKIQDADVVGRMTLQATRPPPPRSFFSRFVDGWSQGGSDDEPVGNTIRDFFGRQGGNQTRGLS